MKKYRAILCVMLLGVLACQKLPSNLHGMNPCDCTTPTQPAQPVPSDAQTGILEIYDAEMNLVLYSDTTVYTIPASCIPSMIPLDIAWSGHDQYGKLVPRGKYLGKVTVLNQCTTVVSCSELFVR